MQVRGKVKNRSDRWEGNKWRAVLTPLKNGRIIHSYKAGILDTHNVQIRPLAKQASHNVVKNLDAWVF